MRKKGFGMIHGVDQKRTGREWKKRGFSCDLWLDPPGQTWEDFMHEADELFMLVEGEIELEIENHVFHPEIGQEVLIPAKIYHSVRNIGGTDCKYLYGYKE